MTTYVSQADNKYFANDNVEEMGNMGVPPVAPEGLIKTGTVLSQNLASCAVDVGKQIEVISDNEQSLILLIILDNFEGRDL